MKVNIGKISLVSAVVAVLLWFVITSICIVDLYATQNTLIDYIEVIWNSVEDLYEYVLEPFNITQVALSDETQEQVEDLRMKHYGLGTSSFLYVTDDTLFYRPQEYEWWSVTFDDGILYVETQDGKWFIQMKEVGDGS